MVLWLAMIIKYGKLLSLAEIFIRFEYWIAHSYLVRSSIVQRFIQITDWYDQCVNRHLLHFYAYNSLTLRFFMYKFVLFLSTIQQLNRIDNYTVNSVFMKFNDKTFWRGKARRCLPCIKHKWRTIIDKMENFSILLCSHRLLSEWKLLCELTHH